MFFVFMASFCFLAKSPELLCAIWHLEYLENFVLQALNLEKFYFDHNTFIFIFNFICTPCFLIVKSMWTVSQFYRAEPGRRRSVYELLRS
jgi:hypothetical protein